MCRNAFLGSIAFLLSAGDWALGYCPQMEKPKEKSIQWHKECEKTNRNVVAGVDVCRCVLKGYPCTMPPGDSY